MYLTLDNKRELMSECGDAATILFEFYLSKAGIEEYEYADDKAARALGWSIRKVQETRKKLTRAGYFKQRTGRYSNGGKIITTYLGKAMVEAYNQELEHYELVQEESKIEDAFMKEVVLKDSDGEVLDERIPEGLIRMPSFDR